MFDQSSIISIASTNLSFQSYRVVASIRTKYLESAQQQKKIHSKIFNAATKDISLVLPLKDKFPFLVLLAFLLCSLLKLIAEKRVPYSDRIDESTANIKKHSFEEKILRISTPPLSHMKHKICQQQYVIR